MKKIKTLVARIAHEVNLVEKPLSSKLEHILDESIVVLIAFAWLGAMFLLP